MGKYFPLSILSVWRCQLAAAGRGGSRFQGCPVTSFAVFFHSWPPRYSFRHQFPSSSIGDEFKWLDCCCWFFFCAISEMQWVFWKCHRLVIFYILQFEFSVTALHFLIRWMSRLIALWSKGIYIPSFHFFCENNPEPWPVFFLSIGKWRPLFL